MSLRSRLLGSALLVVGVAAVGLAGTVSTGLVPSSSAPDGIAFVTPSPVSLLATPALLAAGSVLLVGGTAAAGSTDASARAALAAPALSIVAAFAFGAGLFLAPASVPETVTNPAAQATLLSELPGLHVAGAVVGATLAPVVQATITEDTATLIAGSVLLLVAIAAGASLPLSLVAGGVGGAAAVALLWAVDSDRWRP